MSFTEDRKTFISLLIRFFSPIILIIDRGFLQAKIRLGSLSSGESFLQNRRCSSRSNVRILFKETFSCIFFLLRYQNVYSSCVYRLPVRTC